MLLCNLRIVNDLTKRRKKMLELKKTRWRPTPRRSQLSWRCSAFWRTFKLKGTVVVLSLNRERGNFLNFLGAPMIFYAKSVFLAVHASLHWLNNVSGMYLVQIFLLLICQLGLGHFFMYQPLLPIGWRIVQMLRQHKR
jgi:hypothetical protein